MQSTLTRREQWQIERDVVAAAFALVTHMRTPGSRVDTLMELADRIVALKAEHDAIPLYREPSTDGEW